MSVGQRPFVVTPSRSAEGMVDLGTLSGGTYSSAADVSDDGSVVVGMSDSRRPPHPFIRGTSLHLSLAAESDVHVRVYDATGRLIRTIQNGRLARGDHDIPWDGLDAEGRPMRAGTYFIRAESGGGALNTRVVRVQ